MSTFISKFNKNLDALEKAVDQEFALDYKYPKIYKKVLRYLIIIISLVVSLRGQ